jgi:hypothetical protein
MSDTLYIKRARLSFPKLKEPKASVTGDDPRYSCDFVMPEDHPSYVEFRKTIYAMAKDKWGDKADAILQMVMNDSKRRCFGSGDEKRSKKTMEVYSGYVDNFYITANCAEDDPPQMIRADNGKPVKFESPDWMPIVKQLVGGYWVNAAVRPWLQDNKWGYGIRCELLGIQFAAVDTPFGRGEDDLEALFEPVESAEIQPVEEGGMPSFFQDVG